jgi:hypothetical protein
MLRNLSKKLKIFRIMLVSTFWIPHHLGCEVPCRCEQHHGITTGLRAKFLAEPGPGPLQVSAYYFLKPMLQKILYTTILVNPGLDGPATHAAVTVTACFAMPGGTSEFNLASESRKFKLKA